MESLWNLGENDLRTLQRYWLNSQLNSRVCDPNWLSNLALQWSVWCKNAAMWQLAICVSKRPSILTNKIVSEFISCINNVTFLTGATTDQGLMWAYITATPLFYFWWQRAVRLGSLTFAVELQQYHVQPTLHLKCKVFVSQSSVSKPAEVLFCGALSCVAIFLHTDNWLQLTL